MWTYQDVVDHVCDVFDVDRTNRDLRLARTAVVSAYREMPFAASWSYFDRSLVVLTAASQTTGTVAYDHTGGAYERVVTLTDATWPTWAASGTLLIGDVHYPIFARKSSTEVTLAENVNPGDDLSAGTTYTIYRNSYSLPSTFRRMLQVWDSSTELQLQQCEPGDTFASLRLAYQTPGDPIKYTVRSEGESPGGYGITLAPPPNTARRLELFYEAAPRPLSVEKYSTGTIAISSGGTTVTGTGTAWTSSHVGCVLRVGTSGSEPTSIIGFRDDGSTSNTLNPAVFEAVVTEVASGTSLTIDTASNAAYTTIKYTLSDPIDIAQDAMFSAFLKRVEAEFARMVKREDRAQWERDAFRATQLAMEADSRHANNSSGNPMLRRLPATPRVVWE